MLNLREEEMPTHSSIPAWKFPWTEEPGGLQSKGLQKVKHDWVCMHTCCIFLSYYNLLTHQVYSKQGQLWRRWRVGNPALGTAVPCHHSLVPGTWPPLECASCSRSFPDSFPWKWSTLWASPPAPQPISWCILCSARGLPSVLKG